MSNPNKRIDFLLFCVLLLPSVVGSEPSHPKTFPSSEEINLLGEQYLLVTKAVYELHRRGREIGDYMIALRRKADGSVVIFADPEMTIYQIGSTSKMRTFEVTFDLNGEITDAYFSR